MFDASRFTVYTARCLKFVFVFIAGRMLSLDRNFFHAHTCLQPNELGPRPWIVSHSCFCSDIRSVAICTNAILARSIKLECVSLVLVITNGSGRTGVRKDSATKRALAFNWPVLACICCKSSVLPYEELHFRDLLVDFLHELNDKVDELVLQHFLGVEVGNQE